jgi:hypothetical protein
MARSFLLLALAVVGFGCAAPKAGGNLDEKNQLTAGSGVGRQVEFDHGCPPEKVRVIRFLSGDPYGGGSGVGTVDLDVCGAVRRYKAFAGGMAQTSIVWLDVTSLYPPASLPAPLPQK